MTALMVLLLPVTAAFGSLIPGVSSFFGYRLLVLLVAVVGLLATARRKAVPRAESPVRGAYGAMAVGWILVGILGCVFVSEATPGVRELLAIVLGFLLTYALMAMRSPESILSRLQQGWTLAYVVTALVAVREIATGQHMPNYLTTTDLAGVDTRLTASVFGNPNAYATFLIIVFPILVRAFEGARTLRARLGFAIAVLTVPGFVLASGSRLGLLAVFVEVLLLAIFATRRFRRILLGGALAVGLGLVVVGSGAADQMMAHLPGKLATAAPSQLLNEAAGGSVTSGGRRLNLYRDGLWMMSDTAGLGKGPGQFGVVMAKGEAPYDSGGVTDPHNTFLEIGAQYGAVILLLFLVWSWRCMHVFWRAARSTQGEQRSWAVSMLAVMVGMVIGALANSTALISSVNWTLCATVMVAVTYLEPLVLEGSRESPGALPRPALSRTRAR